MPISVVTRAYRTSELRNLVSNLQTNHEIEKEVIAVCKIEDCNLKRVQSFELILEDSNRFRARITGIKFATYDKILLLDCDQIPEEGLLAELDNRNEDMVIIPEKSLSGNWIGKCLDDWRFRNERLAMEGPTPFIPVIPRFYNAEKLRKAIDRLPPQIFKILSHEDSVLYYEVFKETQLIGFSNHCILNDDPPFGTLMRKAFLYGKYRREVDSLIISDDLSKLIDVLNKSFLNIKELGIGKGFIIQMMRGMMYEIGYHSGL